MYIHVCYLFYLGMGDLDHNQNAGNTFFLVCLINSVYYIKKTPNFLGLKNPLLRWQLKVWKISPVRKSCKTNIIRGGYNAQNWLSVADFWVTMYCKGESFFNRSSLLKISDSAIINGENKYKISIENPFITIPFK